jgi:hypothetical protein
MANLTQVKRERSCICQNVNYRDSPGQGFLRRIGKTLFPNSGSNVSVGLTMKSLRPLEHAFRDVEDLRFRPAQIITPAAALVPLAF